MATQRAEAERRERMRHAVERAGNLSTLPDVVLRISQMVDSPETTGRQLGAEIGKDQVISAKVLKLVNSGFYGFSEPISSIPHAVTMLGFNAVKSLVLSCAVLDSMDDVFPGLWTHSLACARTCALIGRRLGMSDTEELSTIGLLHDLGKVVIQQIMETQFMRIRLRVERAHMLVFEAEKEVLGVHHGEVGGWMLAKWSLPANLTEPIAEHHDLNLRHEHVQRTAVVHLADILVRAEAYGNGGDRRIPRLNRGVLEILSIGIDEIRGFMDDMNQELREIKRF